MKSSSSILIVLSLMLAAVSAAPVPADLKHNFVPVQGDGVKPKDNAHAPMTKEKCNAIKGRTWTEATNTCDCPEKICKAELKYWHDNTCLTTCPVGFTNTDKHTCKKST